MRGKWRHDASQCNRSVGTEIDDGVMADNMKREMSEIDGERRVDLEDVVASSIAGPEIVDGVVT
jgi:hypothetical protein